MRDVARQISYKPAAGETQSAGRESCGLANYEHSVRISYLRVRICDNNLLTYVLLYKYNSTRKYGVKRASAHRNAFGTVVRSN